LLTADKFFKFFIFIMCFLILKCFLSSKIATHFEKGWQYFSNSIKKFARQKKMTKSIKNKTKVCKTKKTELEMWKWIPESEVTEMVDF